MRTGLLTASSSCRPGSDCGRKVGLPSICRPKLDFAGPLSDSAVSEPVCGGDAVQPQCVLDRYVSCCLMAANSDR
jgi:hypothetical protein